MFGLFDISALHLSDNDIRFINLVQENFLYVMNSEHIFLGLMLHNGCFYDSDAAQHSGIVEETPEGRNPLRGGILGFVRFNSNLLGMKKEFVKKIAKNECQSLIHALQTYVSSCGETVKRGVGRG